MTRPFDRLRKYVGPIAAPAYRAAVAWRNAQFNIGRGVRKLPVPVISIGNLSTGGTGKTPTVAWVVRELHARGITPAIAMRGYKPGGHHGQDSDEAEEYRRLLPGVPIVAQPDRFGGLRKLLDSPDGRGVQCVVLDDGFQHRQLHRDLDIVVLDATRDPFADRLLPVGDLREPVEALTRAQAAVISHAESVDTEHLETLKARITQINPRLTIAISEHAWDRLTVFEKGQDFSQQPNWLDGKIVLGLCAIGNPVPFLTRLSAAGCVVQPMILPDHDPYRPATVQHAIDVAKRARVDAIAITEKDWSKLRLLDPSTWPVPIVRPRLSLRMVRGGEALCTLIQHAARKAGTP